MIDCIKLFKVNSTSDEEYKNYYCIIFSLNSLNDQYYDGNDDDSTIIDDECTLQLKDNNKATISNSSKVKALNMNGCLHFHG